VLCHSHYFGPTRELYTAAAVYVPAAGKKLLAKGVCEIEEGEERLQGKRAAKCQTFLLYK
jgi:hypothetical protein